MKTIIERNLPLNVTYNLIDKKYIPIEQSCGTYCCDNCGQIIANIATVKNSNNNEVFNIGFDCLETILINNSLLSTNDIASYEKVKKMIPKILRFAKNIKETISDSRANITGLLFEIQSYPSDFYVFYWLQNNQPVSRDNDYVKLKEMDFNFLLDTLKNIFPKLLIITK